jgi:hypothetical protein
MRALKTSEYAALPVNVARQRAGHSHPSFLRFFLFYLASTAFLP